MKRKALIAAGRRAGKTETARAEAQAHKDRADYQKPTESSVIEEKGPLNRYQATSDTYKAETYNLTPHHHTAGLPHGATIGVVTGGNCELSLPDGGTAFLATGQLFGLNGRFDVRGADVRIVTVPHLTIKQFITPPVSDAGNEQIEPNGIGYQEIEVGPLHAAMEYIPIGMGNIDIISELSARAREKNQDILPLGAFILSGTPIGVETNLYGPSNPKYFLPGNEILLAGYDPDEKPSQNTNKKTPNTNTTPAPLRWLISTGHSDTRIIFISLNQNYRG